MNRLLVSVLVLFVFHAGTANAQFPGKLKDKAKDALKDLGGDKSKDDQAPGDDQSRKRPPARKDPARKYPPGLSFSSVLNGIKLLPKDGQFRLDNIQATFLPDDCKEGFTVLRTAEGQELYQFDWKPDRLKKPYALMNVHVKTDLRSGEKLSGGLDLATPGDYVLDFYLPSEHFFTVPFSVAKVGGDDPFGEGKCYVLSGDWQDWGYLYYVDAKPDQNLHWKVWLRNEGCDEKDIKVRIEIKRDQDGELVCTSREHTTNSCQPKWIRLEFGMVFPEGKEVPHGTYFKAKDLLEIDGAYTLTMKIDDKPYGVWKFAVEGGKLQYAGRTLRGKADPLTFIEGGRDAWWYAREKK